ncbi:MAG: hypothetical protein R2690_03910 [Acidimicrobiales bacterium]
MTRVPIDPVPVGAAALPVVVTAVSVTFLQQGAVRQGPDDDVDECEHAEQAEPEPTVGGHPCEGRFERPGGTDEHGRQHREQQQREQGVPHPEPRGEHAVEGTGRGDAGGSQGGGRHHQRPALGGRCGVVQHDHPDEQQGLEGQQLGADGQHLAQEHPGGRQGRQAERVAHAVARLDRGGALHDQQGAQHDGHPEQPRRGARQDAARRVEGEGEQHHDDQRQRRHLVGGDA